MLGRIVFLFLCTVLSISLLAGQKENKEGKLDMRDIKFKADCDGSEQNYVLILPPHFQKGKKHDVLIALHGHGSDRWQFAKDKRDECRAARDAASENSMIFVSPDYRAKTSWMGPKAEADMLQIIGDIKKNYKTGRVFICGGSMGGSSCLTFTALHPDMIDGVASMNGTANHVEYDNFQDAIKESFGGSKSDVPDEYKKRSAELWPEKFTMPVGISVSGKDTSVPPQSVLRLAEKLKTANPGNVLLIYREETGHSTSYEDAKAILDFVIKKATKK